MRGAPATEDPLAAIDDLRAQSGPHGRLHAEWTWPRQLIRSWRGILDRIGGDDTTLTSTRTGPDDVQPAPRGDGVPESIDRFRLIRRIGAGGMGQVFEAYDPDLDRKIAVKLLHAGSGVDDDESKRLLREARSLAQLNHPNVVEVYGAGIDDERVWLAMELVEGQTLKQWAMENPPGGTQRYELALDLLRQAAAGLTAAHAISITHRDFKPGNVLVGIDGRVRVVDFGLAVSSSPPPAITLSSETAPMPTGSLHDAATRTGRILGTPRYMAPEQYRGEPASPRTDVFAFAVSAWETLHGHPPFHADKPAQLYFAITERRFRSPDDTTVPPRVNRALRKAMSASASRRFRSIEHLLTAIDGGRQRRTVAVVATLSSVAVLLGFASSWSRDNAGDASELCKAEAQQQLGAVDTLARREGIDRALAATGLPYADDASAAVKRSVRRHGREWLSTAGAQCEATGVVSDCLHRSLSAFGETLETMAELSGSEAETATKRIDALLPPSRCVAATARAPSTHAQEQLLTAAEVALASGDHETASTLAEELLGESSLPWHVRADGLTVWGSALGRQDDARAVDRYVDAYQLAIANDASEMAANLAWRVAIEYSLRDDFAAASAWAKRLEAQTTRSGSSKNYPPRELRCRLLEGAQRYSEAKPLCEKALAAMESGDASAARYTSLLHVMANLYSRAGEPEKGLEMSQKLLEEAIERGGELHPRTGGMQMNLGNAYGAMGKPRKAAEHSAAARHIFTELYGPENRWAVSATMNLAGNLEHLGDLEEAASLLEGLVPLLESVPVLQRARVLNNLAGVRVDQGRYEEGLALLAKVEAIETAELRPDDPQTASARMTRAAAYCGLERWAEAAANATEAVEIRERAGETWKLVGSLHVRAFAFRRLGRFDDALEDVSRMLELQEKGEADPATKLTASLDGALTMASAKRWDEAATFAADARAAMTELDAAATKSETPVLRLVEAQIRVAEGGDAASALQQSEIAYAQLEQAPYLAYPTSEAKTWMDSIR